MISAKLVGGSQLNAKLQTLAKKYPGAAAASIYQEGMRVWNFAAKRAPVEFGVLRNTAYVSPPEKGANGVRVEMGFGTQYARRQHEETTWRHPRGGEAKYLENAYTENSQGYLTRLGNRIEENANRGIMSVPLGAKTEPTIDKGALRRRAVGMARKRRAKIKATAKKKASKIKVTNLISKQNENQAKQAKRIEVKIAKKVLASKGKVAKGEAKRQQKAARIAARTEARQRRKDAAIEAKIRRREED